MCSLEEAWGTNFSNVEKFNYNEIYNSDDSSSFQKSEPPSNTNLPPNKNNFSRSYERLPETSGPPNRYNDGHNYYNYNISNDRYALNKDDNDTYKQPNVVNQPNLINPNRNINPYSTFNNNSNNDELISIKQSLNNLKSLNKDLKKKIKKIEKHNKYNEMIIYVCIFMAVVFILDIILHIAVYYKK